MYEGGQGSVFYLLYWIGECGVGRHWRLFVTITPLLQSMESTCHGQVCIVVLVVHLVLSVHAALGICVSYMYSGVLGTHLMQEGSDPFKILNLSHLLELGDMYALTATKLIVG